MKNKLMALGIFLMMLVFGGNAESKKEVQRVLFTGSVNMTAYTSLPELTDSTPFITATGSRVRFGVAAISPDLRRIVGYGAKIVITKFYKRNGCNPSLVPKGMVFYAEDATNSRLTRTVDLWTKNRSVAINFGRCVAEIKIFR